MPFQLIADSGATKCEWCFISNEKSETIFTTGISPYFLNSGQIIELLHKELLPQLDSRQFDQVHFYGSGLGNPGNIIIASEALRKLFPEAEIKIETDLLAAARSLCGRDEGIACIMGTGSNSCYYDGKNIVKNAPSLGYILGDEGSGANLGKKVLQHYLYNYLDADLKRAFEAMFKTNQMEILENLYKKPFPNRYLARFAIFLALNRGHNIVEDILENSFNDFIVNQICHYTESRTLPINFIGSVAAGFEDVLQKLCYRSGLSLGKVLKNPMRGLIKYHGSGAA